MIISDDRKRLTLISDISIISKAIVPINIKNINLLLDAKSDIRLSVFLISICLLTLCQLITA
jgi:hypothetical protein